MKRKRNEVPESLIRPKKISHGGHNLVGLPLELVKFWAGSAPDISFADFPLLGSCMKKFHCIVLNLKQLLMVGEKIKLYTVARGLKKGFFKDC